MYNIFVPQGHVSINLKAQGQDVKKTENNFA